MKEVNLNNNCYIISGALLLLQASAKKSVESQNPKKVLKMSMSRELNLTVLHTNMKEIGSHCMTYNTPLNCDLHNLLIALIGNKLNSSWFLTSIGFLLININVFEV